MFKESDNFDVERGVFHWRPTAWLRVSGDDAASFLQGQFTNDLRALVPGKGVYGLWLNHKGRVVADSFVLQGAGGEFWVGSYFCPAVVIKERLEAFIIADDVVVEDVTSEWSAVTLFGADAETLPAATHGGLIFAGRRTCGLHREFAFPSAELVSVTSQWAGWRQWDAQAIERVRIQSGIPAVPADLGPTELPNEGGLEHDAISFTKGCYLGQEVMARLKSMGQVRRRLLRVRGRGEPPARGATLYQAARRIGEMRTSVSLGDGFIGWALLTLLSLRAEDPLSLLEEGGGESIWVERP